MPIFAIGLYRLLRFIRCPLLKQTTSHRYNNSRKAPTFSPDFFMRHVQINL